MAKCEAETVRGYDYADPGYATSVAFDPERRLFGLTMRWVLIGAAAIVLLVVAVWIVAVAV